MGDSNQMYSLFKELSYYEIYSHGDISFVYHSPTGTVWKVDDFSLNNLMELISKVEKKKYAMDSGISCNASPSDKVALITSTECNMKCAYCYAGGGTYDLPSFRMSPSSALFYLDRIQDIFGDIKWIQFFGGEPLMTPDTIKRVVETYAEREVLFTINTNGTLITYDVAEYLVKSMNAIYISLDGPPPVHNVNRKLLNGGSTFHIVRRGVENLKKLRTDGKPTLIAEATYTRQHLHSGLTIIDLWKYLVHEIGFDDAYITWAMYPPADDFTEDEWVKIREYMDDFTRWLAENDVKSVMLAEVSGLLGDVLRPHPCGAGISSLCITPDGSVYPCYQLINEEFYMGCIKEDEFPNHRFFRVYSRLLMNLKIFNNGCRKCELMYTCVDCLGRRYVSNRSIQQPVNRECEIKRSIMKALIQNAICRALVRRGETP